MAHLRLRLRAAAPHYRKRVGRALRVRRGQIFRLVHLHLQHVLRGGQGEYVKRGLLRGEPHGPRFRFPSQRVRPLLRIRPSRLLHVLFLAVAFALVFARRGEGFVFKRGDLRGGHGFRVALRVRRALEH